MSGCRGDRRADMSTEEYHMVNERWEAAEDLCMCVCERCMMNEEEEGEGMR